MTWIDVMVVAIIIGIAFLESHRGFGLALVDMVGAIIAVKVSLYFAPTLAKTAQFGFSPQDAKALWFMAVFALLAIATVIIGKIIYSTTLLSLDVMDPIVGAILGIVSGMILSHVVLRSMAIATTGEPFNLFVMNTLAAKELVELRAVNAVLTAGRNLGRMH